MKIAFDREVNLAFRNVSHFNNKRKGHFYKIHPPKFVIKLW